MRISRFISVGAAKAVVLAFALASGNVACGNSVAGGGDVSSGADSPNAGSSEDDGFDDEGNPTAPVTPTPPTSPAPPSPTNPPGPTTPPTVPPTTPPTTPPPPPASRGVEVFGGTQTDAACVVASGVVKCVGTSSNSNAYDAHRAGLTPPSSGLSWSTLTAIDGLPSMSAVAVGGNAICGLSTSGEVYCWGWNYNGQLGNGKVANAVGKGKVVFPNPQERFVAVSIGMHTACALTTDGKAYCWGGTWYGVARCGGSGQSACTTGLGAANYEAAALPSLMYDNASAPAVSLAVGYGQACVVTDEGKVRCWGYNPYGVPNGQAAADIAGLSQVADIVPMKYNVCAISDASRVVKCWDHAPVSNSMVVQSITTLGSGVVHLASNNGPAGFCALYGDGAIKCVGTVDDAAASATSLSFSGATTLETRSGLSTLVSGYRHMCGLNAQDAMVCYNLQGSGKKTF